MVIAQYESEDVIVLFQQKNELTLYKVNMESEKLEFKIVSKFKDFKGKNLVSEPFHSFVITGLKEHMFAFDNESIFHIDMKQKKIVKYEDQYCISTDSYIDQNGS